MTLVDLATVTGGMLEWAREVSAADWIVERLHPFATDLGSFLPEGFAAYARILHPASRWQLNQVRKVRWAELAQPAGRPLTATTPFEELDPGVFAEPVQAPSVGTLEGDELNALVDLLAPFTASRASCWFAVWEGYGHMQGPPAIATVVAHPRETEAPKAELPSIDQGALPLPVPPGARVRVPERALALYAGPIEAASAMIRPSLVQSPNLWWPEDRAWCVASEIDFRSTYVGGPQAAIDRILRDDRLEALPARITDRVSD